MHREPLRIVSQALAPMLALCSWISLNPYFLWGSHRHMAIAGMVAGVLAVIAFMAGDRPRRREAVGFALIVIFIFYISALPKSDGTLTRWYFVLPTMLALAIYSDERRRQVARGFAWIFALSLIPGIAVSLATIANIPIEFERLASANAVMAAGRGYYLEAPGALLLGNNSISLPWGGFLFRLCAMYDEPGMVGTIGVLLLAANRFKLDSVVFSIIFVGGMLSCSLAFCLLAVAGFTFRAVVAKSPVSLIFCIMAGSLGLMVAGVFSIEPVPKHPFPDNIARVHYAPPEQGNEPATLNPEGADTQIGSVNPEAATLSADKAKGAETSQAPIAPSTDADVSVPPTSKTPTPTAPPPTLRQTEYLNNRSLPGMDRLVAEYWSSDISTILFGVSSDASVTQGGVSQVVTRILTDFGIVGAILFGGSLMWLAFVITRESESRIWVLLFFGLFMLSIYQRPVIWMPYAFTFFICCSTFAGRNKSLSTASTFRSLQS